MPVAIVLVIMMVVVAITVSSLPKPDNPHPTHWILVTGDQLQFDISGSNSTAPFSGNATLILDDYSFENGTTTFSWHWLNNGSYPADIVDNAVGGLRLAIAVKSIHTEFGDKYARERVIPNLNMTIIQYEGVESAVPYRINVSGQDYHLSMNLVDLTNASRLSGLDNHGIIREFDMPASLNSDPSATSFNPGLTGACIVLSLPKGGEVNYTFYGNESSLCVFSTENFEAMDQGGHVEYDPELSAIGSNRSVQKTFDPGIYFFNVRVPADSGVDAVLILGQKVYE